MKLPKKMHFKHGRYYYVHKNKWHPLSKEYPEALMEYARFLSTPSGMMPDVIDRAMAEIEPNLREVSIKTYRWAAEKLKSAFVEFKIDEVKPMHIHQLLDHHRKNPATANALRNVLKLVFERACIWGIADSNPVKYVNPLKAGKRDRYITEEEFQAIREKATPTLKCMMDVLYITGQRIGDIIALKLSDITEEGIYFKQSKTGNRLMVSMTPDLEQAVRKAKELHSCVRGMTLFHTRQGKPFSYWTIRTLWSRATEAAKVEDAHIHDIRAKTGTDARKQGLDSKGLLGHKSDQSHARYLRSKEIPIVQPVKLRQS